MTTRQSTSWSRTSIRSEKFDAQESGTSISEGARDMSSYAAHDESHYAPPAEVGEMELYHPKSFIGKYVWSQDAKVIAVQYAVAPIFRFRSSRKLPPWM